MKKFYIIRFCYFLLISSPLVVLFSCSDDDPLPVSKAGFEVISEGALEKNVPVKFVNLSTNAATFKWDFGDGASDSITIAPEHTYTAAGSYDVTLTAITEDGQTSMETKTIEIKTRVLVAFSVTNVSFVNSEGNPWDDDETGPDVVFIFGPQSATTNEDIIVTDPINDVAPGNLPLNWQFNEGDGLELNSELYDLVLLDDDPEKSEDPKYDVMFGIEFDPVQYEFGIKDDTDGLLQVSIEGFAIDLFLTFALQ